MSDIDWDRIFRYYGGECSAEERAAFELWLAAEPMHRQLIDALRVASGSTLEECAPMRARPTLSLRAQAKRLRGPWRSAAMAASITLIASAGVAVWAVTRQPSRTGVPAMPIRVTSTRAGQQATVHLADGSTVTLSAVSTLRYPANLEPGMRSLREVELTGEAYFDVVHDAARPFRVRAGGAVAEDIGTTFGVRAYSGESVHIVVASGAVAVRAASAAPEDALVLHRGDLGRLPTAGGVTISHVDPQRYLAWMHGEMVFTQAPLSSVAAEIARHYDIDVRLGDEAIGTRDFTGSFRDERVGEVIDVLCAAAQLRAAWHGRAVTLYAHAIH